MKSFLLSNEDAELWKFLLFNLVVLFLEFEYIFWYAFIGNLFALLFGVIYLSFLVLLLAFYTKLRKFFYLTVLYYLVDSFYFYDKVSRRQALWLSSLDCFELNGFMFPEKVDRVLNTKFELLIMLIVSGYWLNNVLWGLDCCDTILDLFSLRRFEFLLCFI